ncbi:MAG: hypothetical protein PBV01_04910 [Brucella anthropi]
MSESADLIEAKRGQTRFAVFFARKTGGDVRILPPILRRTPVKNMAFL